MLSRQCKDAFIAFLQQPWFASLPVKPTRTDSVDNVPTSKFEGRGDNRLSNSAAANLPTNPFQFRSSRLVDRTANTSTSNQCCVGRVHDCIYLQRRDVCFDASEYQGRNPDLIEGCFAIASSVGCFPPVMRTEQIANRNILIVQAITSKDGCSFDRVTVLFKRH